MTRRPAPAALTVAALTVAVLALTGCGSDGSGAPPSSAPAATSSPDSSSPDSSSPDSSSPDSSAPSSSRRGVAVGEPAPGTGVLLDAGVRRGDLPASYRVTAAATSSLPRAGADDVLARCAGAAPASGNRSVGVRSPVFGREDAAVWSTVERYRSASDVRAATAALSSPRAQRCFGAWFASRRGELTRVTSAPRSSSVTVLPGANDGPTNAVGTASASYTFGGNGEPYPVSVSVVHLVSRSGTVLTRLVTVRTGDHPDAAELTDVLFAVARRTAALR